MKIEERILNEERNVKLSAWIQDVGGEFQPIQKRPAILVLPGGGYSMCSDREAEPVAAAYAKAGFQAFILRYSVGEYRAWPNPLDDYEQAMELIMEHADKWHVDIGRIAVVGFSAGGHLAACAATIAKHKPAAAILGYAALKKAICDFCQPGMPYPVEKVDRNTAPCFMFATRDDNVVEISNTLEFEQKLAACAVRFESHIYSYGNHGFSTGETYLNQMNICPRAKRWVSDSIEWLGEIWGDFTAAGFGEPVVSKTLNSDCEPMLSLNCTVSHLKKQNEQVQELLAGIFEGIDNVLEQRFGGSSAAKELVYSYKIKDLMQMFMIPEETMKNLDEQLCKIENIK